MNTLIISILGFTEPNALDKSKYFQLKMSVNYADTRKQVLKRS